MAGNYPDVPGPRMALDLDGTEGYTIVGGTPTQWTLAQLQALTDESAGEGPGIGTGNSASKLVFIFPEKRDVVGYHIAVQGSWGYAGGGVWETSVDTTNGIDGTWVSRGALAGVTPKNTALSPFWRTAIQTVNWAGVKAARITVSTGGLDDFGPRLIHLYGSITAGQNPDRLALWHPTLDQPLGGAALDESDTARGSTADITFRVKNLSATLTATTITLSQAVLTDTTPTFASQHTLSSGGAFASTATIASLAPGAISAVCTLRRATSPTAVLGLYAGRIKAVATSWA